MDTISNGEIIMDLEDLNLLLLSHQIWWYSIHMMDSHDDPTITILVPISYLGLLAHIDERVSEMTICGDDRLL